MKRLVSKLCKCPCFIRRKNVSLPAFFFSLLLFLSLSISKAFHPIARSSFFFILSPTASLFNSLGSQSITDSMLREQNTVGETEPQHFTSCLSYFRSTSCPFLSLIKRPTCLLVLFGGVSHCRGFYFYSSPLFTSPLLSRVLRCDISFLWALGRQVAF